MKQYKYIFSCIFAAVLFAASPSVAEVLSDDEAYSRAYTVCSQKVFPLWRPKEGEAMNKDNYARTPPRLKKIAACMMEKGVPAAYSDETQSIVRTGSGFGQNVNIKIEDLFPADITKPKESPHKANENILPDPDYSRAEDMPAPLDREDVRIGAVPEGYEEPRNDLSNKVQQQPRTEQPAARGPTRRAGDIGVITGKGTKSNDGGNDDPKPIFLPR